MMANTLAAIARLPVAAPLRFRPYMVVVIGLLLGSGLAPDIFANISGWALSIFGLLIYLFVCGVLVVPYYMKIGGYSGVTAYFAAMPGGLNEMTLLGGHMGGNEQDIALAHASRIFLVVTLLSLWFQVAGGADLGGNSSQGVSLLDVSVSELGIFASAGATGWALGKLLKFPAPMLLGPMLISAVLHLGGIVENPPPREIINIAQVVIGTIIGCSFIGVHPEKILKAILLAVGAALIMLLVSSAIALGFSSYLVKL